MRYADDNCPKCKGDGVIILDAGSVRRCSCYVRAAFLDAVGDAIFRATRITDPKLLACLTRNIALVGEPVATDAALRLAYGSLFTSNHLCRAWVEMTDDELALTRLPGDHGDAEKNRYDRAMETEFLVVRVGARMRNHSWFPSALEEALDERRRKGRPTWLVMDHELSTGDVAYSESLARLLAKHWPVVRYRLPASASSPDRDARAREAQRVRL